MKREYLIVAFTLLVSLLGFGQVTVTVDINEQRFLNGVSNFDRSKFIILHSKQDGDSDITDFLSEYNVGFGRRFFGPFASAGVGNFPSTTPDRSDPTVRKVKRFVTTIQPKFSWRYNLNADDAANWAVEYWLNRVDDNNRPEFWEPMNEPFVHANDPEFSVDQPNSQLVRVRMTEWFAALGRKVQETPELANMKMVGYASAFPSMEINDFGLWEARTKMFIDGAGEYMDAISVHTYDGVNLVGQDSRRSGSNSEAIIDLIEAYTAEKFGTPKQIAITEYGIIESGYPPGYSDAESAISLRGINSMLFNFLEREDNIAITIPFITDKSTFHYNNGVVDKPYVPALFRPLNQLSTAPFTPSNWVLTYKANFYRLWQDVKGNRSFINTNDFDVQAQSFVDGNKVHLVLNNLDDSSKTIMLNMLSGSTGVTEVKTKSLKVSTSADPSYTVTTSANLPSSITLADGETLVLEITYNSNVTFTKSITREKYYGKVTSTTPQANRAPTFRINGNVVNTFDFKNVNLGTSSQGIAMLRVGLGIPINSSSPASVNLPNQVLVNGTSVAIPTNWKGYDQRNRNEFFGVIEVPVDISLLNQGDNTISVRFAATGGRMSSLILSVERREAGCTLQTLYADTDGDGLGDPENSIQSCRAQEGFVSNADDDCPDDSTNNCISNVPGIIQAEDFQVKSSNVQTENTTDTGGGSNIGFIMNGDFTEYRVNVADAGTYTFDLRVASQTSGGTVTVLSNGNVLNTVNVNNTGGWQVWETVTTTVDLPEGVQDLRLAYSGGGGFLFNINFMEFTLSSLSIEDFDLLGLQVFPNPVADRLFIKGIQKEHTFHLFDITGRKIMGSITRSSDFDINFSGLSNGLYILIDEESGKSLKLLKN